MGPRNKSVLQGEENGSFMQLVLLWKDGAEMGHSIKCAFARETCVECDAHGRYGMLQGRPGRLPE